MSCGTCQVVTGRAVAPGVPAEMAVQQQCPACGQFVGADHVCPDTQSGGDEAFAPTTFVVMGSFAGVPDPGSVRVLTDRDQAEAARRDLCREYGLDPDGDDMGESEHCVAMVEVEAERPTQLLTFEVDGEECAEAAVLRMAHRTLDRVELYEVEVGTQRRFRGSDGRTYAVFVETYLSEVEPDDDEEGRPDGSPVDGSAEAESILAGACRELGAGYWEDGYTEAEVDAGCEYLTRVAGAMGLPGDVCVVWDHRDMYGFGGDSGLYYVAPDGRGCELETMPFLNADEGEAQAADFLDELAAVAGGRGRWQKGLERKHREGYNVAWRYSPNRELG
jgi:hypothetical protein